MEKLRVRDEDLEFAGIDGGGIAMYTYQGKPFTGIIEDYFFENEEQLASETEYLDGYQQELRLHIMKMGKLLHILHQATISYMVNANNGMRMEI